MHEAACSGERSVSVVSLSAHYAKRIFETFFVHSFSRATMPIFNLIRNCGYYWTFAGLMSYFINHPRYTSPGEASDDWIRPERFVSAREFQVSRDSKEIEKQWGSSSSSSSSSSSETKYVIPSGFLFDYVTSRELLLRDLPVVGL